MSKSHTSQELDEIVANLPSHRLQVACRAFVENMINDGMGEQFAVECAIETYRKAAGR